MKIVRRGALPVGGDSGLAEIVRAPRRASARSERRGTVRSRGRLAELRRARCSPSSTSTTIKPLRVVVDAANGMAGAMLPPGARAPAQLDVGPLLLRAGRDLPEPRAEPAPPGEPRVHRREGRAGRRRPRRRVRRRRRPLLLRRRHRRVRPGRLRDGAPRRGGAREGAGREGHLRRARELGRARDDRAGRRRRRSSTASATRSSSTACARRTPSSRGEVSAHYYFRDFSQADTGVVPFLLMLELVSRRGDEALGAPRARSASATSSPARSTRPSPTWR